MLDAIVSFGFLVLLAVWAGALAYMNLGDSGWRKRK